MFVLANFHAFLYSESQGSPVVASLITYQYWKVHKWDLSGIMSVMSKQQFVQYGIAALVGVELLFIGSLPYVRNRMYTLFMFSHIAGIALFFGCVSLTLILETTI